MTIEPLLPRSLITAPYVAIPPRLAAFAARALRVGIRELARRDVYVAPQEMFDVVRGLEVLAAGMGTDVGTPMGTEDPGGRIENMDGWVAPSVAASLVGCHRNAVYSRISRGSIEVRRDARGRYLVNPADLEAAPK